MKKKNFDNWNLLKQNINKKNNKFHIKQGEIWFISIGQNVGYEIFGKKDKFLRPVLVYKKLSKNTFIGIPLTSQDKLGKFYFSFNYKDNIKSIALLEQIRFFDTKRMVYKSGSINRHEFDNLKYKLSNLLNITPEIGGGYTCQKDKQRTNTGIISKEKSKVKLTPLKQIFNPKGDIYHAMKKSDDGYDNFGEAYFSTVHKGDIKGWKKHTKMTLNLIVPVGAIEFVVYDEHIKEFFSTILSKDNYQRLTVPPSFWMAFRGVGEYNMLLNLASIEHDPDEAINKELSEIQYEW